MRTILRQMPSRRSVKYGRSAVELGYPWLTYGAIVELEDIIKPHFRIFEFGTGGSTVFFSRRSHSVKTVDNSQLWSDKVRNMLPVPSNVEFFVFKRPFRAERLIEAEPNEYYDLILVDPDPHYIHRIKFMNASVPKIKKGGYLVVDNYDDKNIWPFDYSQFDVYTFDKMSGHGGRGTRICVKK